MMGLIKIKTTMKGLFAAISGSLVMALLAIGCANTNRSAQEIDLKQNAEMREEVFDQILNDEELFNEFMNEMMSNQQSMNWMVGHQRMLEYMYTEGNMQDMMQQNPMLRKHMLENMSSMMQQDSAMYNEMNDMMKNRGRGHMGPMH